jgi:sugar lactone lactonase YvrE
MIKPILPVAAVLTILSLAAAAPAQSIFTQKPDDPGAVVLTADQFQAKGDGVADDSDALQAAVNRGRGSIVLIPEGRYRLGKTVYVPTGTRVFGFGKSRPVFVLGPNTPGFQELGPGYPYGYGKYMIHFAQGRQQDGAVVDASELDFNSAMSNIDFEIGDGNPAAVGVRFKVAQHSYLSYMNFKVGSGLAALEDIGNASNDLHITGGKYGIITTRTSPNWQFVLSDTVLENQSAAGVKTQDVGFSFVRCQFANMPVAIEIPEGETDQIYGRDLRFENISKAGVVFGDPNHFKNQVTLVNTACTDVPQFIGNSLEKLPAPGKHYVVDRLSAGLEIGPDGREVGIVTRHKERALQAPAPVVPSDIPALPPMEQWFKVAPNSDLQAAINEHRVLYFPMGSYRANAPLTLRPDSVLIGLHCSRTTVSSIVAPKGGAPFVSGLGFSAVAGSPNILWQSGEKSAMDDIAFGGGFGGGGGFGRGGGGRGGPGTATGPGAPGAATGPGAAVGPGGSGGRGGAGGPGGFGGPAAPGGAGGRGAGGEAQPYMLVNNGGGGAFRNVWVEGGGLPTGLRVEDTSTPGKIYQLSNEHHTRVEVVFRNVQNWEINCLQTEEESGQQNTYTADIEGCQNLVFANTYMYRVSRTTNPKSIAVQVRNSDNIVFDNMHIFSQTRVPFDNAVLEEGSGVLVRANNFTHLVVGKSMKKGDPLPLPATFARDAKLEQLATGFSNATSLTADDAGRVYFTDAVQGRIYRWNDADKKADVLTQISGQNQPQVMGFVKPSSLLIAAFAPGARQVGAIGYLDINGGQPQVITETADPKPGTALLLPVGIHNRMDIMQDYMNHRGYQFRSNSNTSIIRTVENEHRGYFYAPDSNVALMAGGTGRPIMQASQMAIVEPGQSFYLTSEDDCRTWLATLSKDFKLTAKLFADRGGNSVVADADGNVYIADGNVCVYDKTGKQIGTLETPERASGLAFGGPDKKTLYIGARSSFYAIRMSVGGK